ncbi:MAG TPA: MBL fold metallo-hydrolase [Acidimicrobiia bacterium]|nr:MBL fold metallo-hydrolase [Acidimicrobiia bacterium]
MTKVRLTHIGGPTLLLEFDGWRILTDPTFDDPGRTYRFGWGTSSRKTGTPAVAAPDIGPIDLVLLTHDHHDDNLDGAGRALLASADVVVTTVPGAARLGAGTRGLAAWDSTRVVAPDRPDIDVVATPCRHGPPLSRPIAGAVVGFALRWDGQEGGALWISGDTVLTRSVRSVAHRIDVGVAVLHLGGVTFPVTGRVRYTMNAREAVELTELVAPHTTIPVHYEGWSHFREGRDAIERAFADAAPRVRDSLTVLARGTPIDIAV